MKRHFGYALILAALSTPAFAAKNSQTVTVPQAVTVGSTQLPAGNYKVAWTGTGSNVQVTFTQQDAAHPATGTVTARLVDEKHDHTAVTINSTGGVNTIQNVQLNKVSLVLAGASASAGQ
jgi:hypothetical protein